MYSGIKGIAQREGLECSNLGGGGSAVGSLGGSAEKGSSQQVFSE